MNTRLDDRATLMKIIEKLDTCDMKQMMAFAAGYEAGKRNRSPDLSRKVQVDHEILVQLCRMLHCEAGELLDVIFVEKGEVTNGHQEGRHVSVEIKKGGESAGGGGKAGRG